MTTRSIGGGCRLAVSPKKAPQSPPFLSEKRRSSYSISQDKFGVWRILAGYLDPELTIIPESG
jgi:hypothetical protein